VNKHIVIGTFC